VTLGVTLVASPGIGTAGPTNRTWTDQTLIQRSGSPPPLVRFTGDIHDWSATLPTSPANPGAEILQLTIIVKTGADDLRGGPGPNDNCDATVMLANGATVTAPNINSGAHWNNDETHVAALPLLAGTTVGDVRQVTLHTQFAGGLSGDNWNVDEVTLVARLSDLSEPLGSVPSVAVAANANRFVFRRGTDNNLWQAFWDGSKWNGPVMLGMGPLG
jgi:hypothetical protein